MHKTFLVMILSSLSWVSGQSLENTRWNLSYYPQGEKLVRAIPSAGATAEFMGGNIGGNTGCNTFGGAYTQEGQKLTFGQMRQTLRACVEETVNAQERAYIQALERVRSFTLERGVLRLKDESGKTLLIFAQARPGAIRGREWTVTAINTGDAIVSALEGTRPTATFGANGRVSGNTGCNQYSATYTLEGFILKIGSAVSTRRACVNEEANRQETAFLRALEGVNGFRITGERLELYGANRRILVSLTSGGSGTTSGSVEENPEARAYAKNLLEVVKRLNPTQVFTLTSCTDPALIAAGAPSGLPGSVQSCSLSFSENQITVKLVSSKGAEISESVSR